MTFGHTTPEKIIMVVTAVLAWLMIGRTMRSGKLGVQGWITMVSCSAVILYISYLSIGGR